MKGKNNFEKLIGMCRVLRAPDGCPWDRSRTIPELKGDLLEEAQEIATAIENGDYENLEEEIGDVMFCLALMIQIAQEKKIFNANSVIRKVVKKIESRHTWVFGKDKGKVKTAEDAVKLWKENKEKLKKKK